MKTIFDIIRLLNNKNNHHLRLPNKGYIISFDINDVFSAIQIKRESDDFWYSFIIYHKSRIITVEIPNLITYDSKSFDISLFDDILSLDDTQIILIYGRNFPDYMSGDITKLYDAIAKEIDS